MNKYQEKHSKDDKKICKHLINCAYSENKAIKCHPKNKMRIYSKCPKCINFD